MNQHQNEFKNFTIFFQSHQIKSTDKFFVFIHNLKSTTHPPIINTNLHTPKPQSHRNRNPNPQIKSAHPKRHERVENRQCPRTRAKIIGNYAVVRLGVGITAALKLCTGGRPPEGSIGRTRTYPRFKYPSIETGTCWGKTSGFAMARAR